MKTAHVVRAFVERAAKDKLWRPMTLPSDVQKIEKLHVPQKSKNTEFLEGPPAEVAKKLVEKLKNEMRVI